MWVDTFRTSSLYNDRLYEENIAPKVDNVFGNNISRIFQLFCLKGPKKLNYNIVKMSCMFMYLQCETVLRYLLDFVVPIRLQA